MEVRRGVAVFIGFVVIAVGAVALGGGDEVPRVGRVVCAKEGARVLTPVVSTQTDGLHLQVVNVGKDRRYEVSSRTTAAGTIAGVLPADGIIDLQLTLSPGEIEFACLRVGTGERLVVSFELQDPDELWTPDALACADQDSGVFETDYAVEGFEETARRALPGLEDADRLVKPGYPDTDWHGELHVVIREERTIGRVVRVLNHGTWNLTVDACPGTDLTEGAVAETGAT